MLKKILSIVTLCALLAFTASASTTVAPNGGGILQEIEALEAQGDLATALIKLRNAIRDHPDDSDLRLAFGRILLNQGNIPHAETAFTQARDKGYAADEILYWMAKTKLAQGDLLWIAKEAQLQDHFSSDLKARMHALRGQALVGRQMIDEARTEIGAALKLAPDLPDVILAQARLDMATGKQKQGETRIDDLLTRDPHNVDALLIKAALLKQRKDMKGALEIQDRAIALRPNGVSLRLDRATTLLALDRSQEADEEIGLVLANIPEHPLARLLRAQRLSQQKKTKEAWEFLLPVMPHLQSFTPANLLAAALTLEQDQLQQARTYLDAVLKDEPENAAALRLMAEYHLRSKAFDKAVPLLEKIQAESPDDPMILARLATAYGATGKTAEAAALFEQASALDPENQALKLRLGMAHMAEGDSQAAEDTLIQLSDDPTTGPQAASALAMIHMRKGDWPAALAAAESYQKQMPDSPLPELLMSRIYQAKGDDAAALKHLLAAREIDPAFQQAAFELAARYRKDKQTEKEAAIYEELLRLDPKNVRALLGQITLAATRGENTEALHLAKRASAMAPDSVLVGKIYTDLLIKTGDKKEALAVAERLVAAASKSPEAYVLLSRIHFDMGDLDGGIAALRKTKALTEQAPAVHLKMVEALNKDDKSDAARKLLEETVQIFPDLLPAWVQLLADEQTKTDLEGAIALARKAESILGGGRALAELLVGDLYFRNKDPQAALTHYQEGFKETPSTRLAVRVAQALAVTGTSDQAKDFLGTWLAEHPDDTTARMSLANFLLQEKDEAAAISQYEQVLTHDPKAIIALNNLAYLAGKSDPQKGLVAARQAWGLMKNNPQPSIADTYGWLLVRVGEVEKGLPLLEFAATKDESKDPTTQFHFASALAQSGQNDRAAEILRPVLEKTFPEQAEAKALFGKLTAK
ncbi:PEP-CTERM system TPR-repeat protein PrsT [Magnetospira thiophila]